MAVPPSLVMHFRSRRPAPAGSRGIILVADWLTRTWFRFDATLLSGFIVLAAVIDPILPMGDRVLLIAFSPIASMALVPILRLIAFALSFVPVLGAIIGIIRFIRFRLFARLVAEPAPDVHFPLWF